MNENNNRAELEMLTFGSTWDISHSFSTLSFGSVPYVVCKIPVDFIFGCGFSFQCMKRSWNTNVFMIIVIKKQRWNQKLGTEYM